jgi:hypothetical protein
MVAGSFFAFARVRCAWAEYTVQGLTAMVKKETGDRTMASGQSVAHM